MKVIVGNDIKVQFPSEELIRFCENELVLSNPDYYKKQAMGRYTGNIEKNLYLYEKRGDTLVLPFGVVRRIWRLIDKASITTQFARETPLNVSGSLPLYEYQTKALNALRRNKGGILQAPCGSGKTQIGIALIKELGLKALWITHTHDLLTQSMLRAKDYLEGDFGTITKGRVDIGADITFATVQTLVKLDLQKYANQWNVVIVDEAHKLAGTPTRVMQFYKVVTNLNARYKYGLSATVHRADGLIKSTYAVLGDKAHTITDEEVGDKIVKAKHMRVNTGLPQSEDYLGTDGVLDYNSLISYVSENEARNELLVEHISFNSHVHASLVLCHRVEHVMELTKRLRMRNIQAFPMYGSVPDKLRKQVFDEVREGVTKVLVATFSLAKEGLDIPNLDRLYLATPHKDYAIVKQSAGRVERNIKGKGQPVIYDFVDENIGYLKRMYGKRRNILRRK